MDEAAASTRHFPPPTQRIFDLDVEVTLGKPAELAMRLFDVADQVGASRQAGGGPQYAARETGHACCLGHELPNAIAGAAFNIELLCADGWPCTLQPVQRTEMRIGQIADMDKIADAGAIRRRIVVA